MTIFHIYYAMPPLLECLLAASIFLDVYVGQSSMAHRCGRASASSLTSCEVSEECNDQFWAMSMPKSLMRSSFGPLRSLNCRKANIDAKLVNENARGPCCCSASPRS